NRETGGEPDLSILADSKAISRVDGSLEVERDIPRARLTLGPDVVTGRSKVYLCWSSAIEGLAEPVVGGLYWGSSRSFEGRVPVSTAHPGAPVLSDRDQSSWWIDLSDLVWLLDEFTPQTRNSY